MYMCVCVCVCVYIYIYIYIYTRGDKLSPREHYLLFMSKGEHEKKKYLKHCIVKPDNQPACWQAKLKFHANFSRSFKGGF